VTLPRSTVLKVALVAFAVAAIFLALDSTITGPALIDGYRRSADDRHVTATVILSQVDVVIGQSLREGRDGVVVSVRIRRPPAVTTSLAVFREVTFDLREPLGTRAVVDEGGNIVREER
jgi:hypothetical protein